MSTSKINPMCMDCTQRGNGCEGTACQTWTGCVRRTTHKTICKPRLIYTPDDATGHPYNVQLWHSHDGGKTFAYAGCGKFFKDYYEAEAYRKQSRENLAYDLMFGCLGNGITVCNRAHEVGGDYPIVAHIDDCGAIHYRTDAAKLPEYAREEINRYARAQERKFKEHFLKLQKFTAVEELDRVVHYSQWRNVIADCMKPEVSMEQIYNDYIRYVCLNEKRTMPTL